MKRESVCVCVRKSDKGLTSVKVCGAAGGKSESGENERDRSWYEAKRRVTE